MSVHSATKDLDETRWMTTIDNASVPVAALSSTAGTTSKIKTKKRWIEEAVQKHFSNGLRDDFRQDAEGDRGVRDINSRLDSTSVSSGAQSAARERVNELRKYYELAKMKNRSPRGLERESIGVNGSKGPSIENLHFFVDGKDKIGRREAKTNHDDTPKANNRNATSGTLFEAPSLKVEKPLKGKMQSHKTIHLTGEKAKFQFESKEDDDNDSKSKSQGESSEEVDRRWKSMASRFLDDSSEEVDSRWENLSDRVLNSADTGPSLDECPDTMFEIIQIGTNKSNQGHELTTQSIEHYDNESKSKSEGESSNEVDRKWKNMASKFLDDSSDEVDTRWETLSDQILNSADTGPSLDECRDTLLDVNSIASPRDVFSESNTFEDDLIQDCVDTGLPSPRKAQPRQQPQNSGDSNTDCGDSFHTYPSSLPGIDLRERTQMSTKRNNAVKKETFFQNAQIETVTSGLTIEDDDKRNAPAVQPSFSSLSDIVMKTHQSNAQGILQQLSSCSHPEELSNSKPQLLSVLSDESDSNVGRKCFDNSIKKEPQKEHHLSDPTIGRAEESTYQHVHEPVHEPVHSPRIEVTLQDVSSQSDSSEDEARNTTVIGSKNTKMESAMLSGDRNDLGDRMLWWRQNGSRLVNATRQNTATDIRSSQKSTIKNSHLEQVGSPTSRTSTDPLVCRTTSLFIDSSVSESTYSETSSFRARRSTLNAAGSVQPSIIVDLREMDKSRAPQPNPDAQSSNSLNRDRRSPKKTAREISNGKPTPDILRKEQKAENNDVNNDVKERARRFIEQAKARQTFVPEPADENANEVTSQNVEATDPSPTSTLMELDDTEENVTKRSAHSAEVRSTQGNCSAKSKDSEPEVDAEILDVASSLSGGTDMPQQHPQRENDNSTLQHPNKSSASEGDAAPQELHVEFWGDKSSETQLSATSIGVPSWRIDSKESLSDFRLELKCSSSGSLHRYDVHKHVLAVGPRRSETFVKLFRSNTSSKSNIVVAEKAIKLFPHILDFMYCHDFDIELSNDTVVGYRYLARLLKIVPLLIETSTFILRDMKVSNMSTFISDSYHYRDTILQNLIAAKCGEEIHNIDLKDLMWSSMEPALFVRVISCPRIDRKKHSSYLSLLAVEYQTLHKYEMDADSFETITTEAILPIIDHKAAIPLLEICEEYGAQVVFQPLQKRCAKVMAYNWKITPDLDRKRLFSLLRSLPSNFTVDFLEIVETGKAIHLLDGSISSQQRPIDREHYESVESFTMEKLCDNCTLHNDEIKSLSWRMDPAMTFSDWTIKVKHGDDGQMDIFKVHKHILAIGQHRSTFFADAFFAGKQYQSKKGSTTIQLAEEPASLIPDVLDFIYSPKHELVVSTKSALALRFLARILGIWLLNKEVTNFIYKDMKLSNILFYLEQSRMYDDDKVINLAIRRCAVDIRDISVDSDVLKGMKAEFFGRVVASPEIDKTASCHINSLIARFFTLNDLDEKILAELMKQVPMNDIDCESAVQLLEAMSGISSNEPAIFADIRRRCGNVLVDNWKDVREEHRVLAFRIFRKLDSALVTDLFDAVENNYYQEHMESMSVQSKLVKRYRSQLSDAKIQRETELAKVREEMDAQIAKLLERQGELEQELAHCKDTSARKTIRSSGVYPRVSSPKRASQASPPKRAQSHDNNTKNSSLIPRLATGAQEASVAVRSTCSRPQVASPASLPTSPVADDILTIGSTGLTRPNDSPAVEKKSLFGRLFHCGPSDPETEVASPKATDTMETRHFEEELSKIDTQQTDIGDPIMSLRSP